MSQANDSLVIRDSKPMALSVKDLAARFWEKVDRGPKCWTWKGALKDSGYGVFFIGGRPFSAHRVAYELEFGSIPLGVEIHHACHNKTCVNPRHLEGVTPTEHRVREGIKPWTTSELAELRRLAPMGARTVAELLNRSVWSVRNQARRLRISLRPPGERGGLLLGQPRSVSFIDDPKFNALRSRVLEGVVDIDRINRRAELIARDAPLCPKCVARPQEVETSGLCVECHLKILAEAHALEPGVIEAQRTLDRERQRKHRRREAAEKEVAP